MNKTAKTAVFLTLTFFAVTACAGGPEEQSETNALSAPGRQSGRPLEVKESYTFLSDVAGVDWVLTEVQVNGEKTGFNRSKLTGEASAKFFTLRFDGDQIGGIAAPNRYFGPYTSEENNTLKIGILVSTKMALLQEPEGLNEHEYNNVLQNVSRWKIAGDYLELYSTGNDGTETTLVFFAAE